MNNEELMRESMRLMWDSGASDAIMLEFLNKTMFLDELSQKSIEEFRRNRIARSANSSLSRTLRSALPLPMKPARSPLLPRKFAGRKFSQAKALDALQSAQLLHVLPASVRRASRGRILIIVLAASLVRSRS